jgi:hypothetical protein
LTHVLDDGDIPVKKIELYCSQSKCFQRGGLGLIFVALGILLLQPWIDRPGHEIIGWLSIGFFGPVSLLWVLALTNSKPVLVIDDHGLQDRHFGLIPWDEIMQVKPTGEFLSITVKDEQKYIARLSPLLKFTSSLNQMLGFQKVLINLAFVDNSTASNAYVDINQRLSC